MKNIGNVDRVIRILIAVALFSLMILLHGNLKWLGLLGLIPLSTAIIGVLPIVFHSPYINETPIRVSGRDH